MMSIDGNKRVYFDDAKIERQEMLENSKFTDTFLLMTAGVMLVWSIVVGIVNTTAFSRGSIACP